MTDQDRLLSFRQLQEISNTPVLCPTCRHIRSEIIGVKNELPAIIVLDFHGECGHDWQISFVVDDHVTFVFQKRVS